MRVYDLILYIKDRSYVQNKMSFTMSLKLKTQVEALRDLIKITLSIKKKLITK